MRRSECSDFVTCSINGAGPDEILFVLPTPAAGDPRQPSRLCRLPRHRAARTGLIAILAEGPSRASVASPPRPFAGGAFRLLARHLWRRQGATAFLRISAAPSLTEMPPVSAVATQRLRAGFFGGRPVFSGLCAASLDARTNWADSDRPECRCLRAPPTVKRRSQARCRALRLRDRGQYPLTRA